MKGNFLMNLGRYKKIFQTPAQLMQLKQKYPRYFWSLILLIGLVTSTVVLSVYAYLGTFSRYYADDYCMSSVSFSNSLLNAIATLYKTWSNRYAGMVLLSLSEKFGRSAIHYWLLFTLVAWVAALSWAILKSSRLLRLNFSRWMAILLAELVVFFTIMESPNPFQTLFWRIGLITYTLPMAFLALLIGLILNGVLKARDGRQTRWGLILGLVGCAVISFFAGGLSETYVALQTGLLGLAIVCVLVGTRGKIRLNWILWVGISLIGSLVAMWVVIHAPGNAIRQGSMPASPDLLKLVYSSAANGFLFIYISLQDYSFQTVLLFLLVLFLAYGVITSNTTLIKPRPSRLVWALLLTPLIGYLLIVAICAPSVFAESSYPEARVLIEARFIMVLFLSIEGLIIGTGLGQLHTLSNEVPPLLLRMVVLLITIVLLSYPLYDARKMAAQVPDYRARASAWDARNAQILTDKAQGLEKIQVKEFDSISGISELSPDTDFWVNGCAASFYGVHSIKAGTLP
jgi:hypothetical protein